MIYELGTFLKLLENSVFEYLCTELFISQTFVFLDNADLRIQVGNPCKYTS